MYGAKASLTSHDLAAELLRRAAGDDLHKRMLAGLPLVSRDWCWTVWLEVLAQLPAEDQQWIRETLLADPAWGYGEKISESEG